LKTRNRNRATRTAPLTSLVGGWSVGGASIVQRLKRFAVVCYAGIDPQSKKQRQKWFGGVQDAARSGAIQDHSSTHAVFSSGAGPYGSPRLRVQDFLDAWIDERVSLKQIRDSTEAVYRNLTRVHIHPHLGHIPLARLSPPAIQALYVHLLCNLSPSTVHQVSAILNAALNDAVRRGLIVRNQYDTTKSGTV
jgi:hypothetical protein